MVVKTIKDYLNVGNVKNFIGGQSRYVVWLNDPRNLPLYILEQIAFRAYLCRDCLRARKCTECGCSTPNMFFAIGKVDVKKRWEPWINDVIQWMEYKEKNHEKWQEFDDFMESNSVDIFSRDLFKHISGEAGAAPDGRRKPVKPMSVRRGHGVLEKRA